MIARSEMRVVEMRGRGGCKRGEGRQGREATISSGEWVIEREMGLMGRAVGMIERGEGMIERGVGRMERRGEGNIERGRRRGARKEREGSVKTG